GAPIRNESGVIVGVVLVFRDISEQVMIEEQLRQSQKMDSIGQLAGGIAHDFNNMLTGIMGAADVLSRKLGDNRKLQQYADIIVTAAQKASRLTRKLLDFSHKGKMVSTRVDLHDIIRDTILLLERSIDRRIEIRQHLAAERTAVNGDPVQLQNALINLCINSRDAMPEGGTLSLATENIVADREFCRRHGGALTSGEYLRISVRDTGHGIEPQLLPRIFEPFFTTKDIGEGTGLGLSAVYGAVAAHKGVIECNSTPGQGTEFTLYLPVVRGDDDGNEEKSSLPSGSGVILLIDDEEFVRRLAQDILQDLGYQVLVAPDGIVGTDIFRREKDRIDVVIIDMVMPGLSGRDTFLRLAEIDPNVKVIFSSGFTRDQSMEEVLNRDNILGFVQKPFRIADLSEAVAAALGAGRKPGPGAAEHH
ncbi:MAG: ATP-binding protein, partial [Victivallales bacterium]|nr:ATP-binding protein [Victivallales bacterium]